MRNGLPILFAGLALSLLCACNRSPLPGKFLNLPIPLKTQKVILDLPNDSSGDFLPVVVVRANDDPWPDLYVQRRRPDNGIYVSYGSPAGFGPFELAAADFGGFDSEFAPIFGDLDGDGIDDALLQKKNHLIWTALKRERRFEFKQKSFDGGAFVVDMPTMLWDVNNDKCADVVIVNLWKDILVLLNRCHNPNMKDKVEFEQHRVALHMPDDPRRYAFANADVNNDRVPDWVIFTGESPSGAWQPHSVYVAYGKDNGTSTLTPFKAMDEPFGGFSDEEWPPKVIDVNGDALPDIVLRGHDGSLYAALNQGDGHFKLSDKRYCCLGGSEFDTYPMQMRSFDTQSGVFAALQHRGKPVIEYLHIKW
jgi:hypothetical protein